MGTDVLFFFIISVNYTVFLLYVISAFYVICTLKFDLDIVSRFAIACYFLGILVRTVYISFILTK